MKILADVNISPRVVEELCRAGYEAVRITDLLDARSPDEEVLAEASRQSAILISRDQDFSALVAVSGAVKPSLINIRMSTVAPEVIAAAIIAMLREAADALAAGAIVTIDDGGARLHRLPLA